METTADVTLDKVDDGFAITAVHLTLKAKIPGADQAKFEELTGKAKAGCPVSKLLKAISRWTPPCCRDGPRHRPVGGHAGPGGRKAGPAPLAWKTDWHRHAGAVTMTGSRGGARQFVSRALDLRHGLDGLHRRDGRHQGACEALAGRGRFIRPGFKAALFRL
jgi:hypothetical protein